MIRAYSAEHLETIMDIWYRASKVGHPFLSEKQLAADRKLIVEKSVPAAKIWLYEFEGEIAGFLAMTGNHIGGFFVDPNYHRQGIGRRLMAYAQTRFGHLTVEVFRENRIAQSFYFDCGFRLFEERIDDYFGLPILVLEWREKG